MKNYEMLSLTYLIPGGIFITDLVEELFTFLEQQVKETLSNKSEVEKRMFKMGIVIMLGHMLREQFDRESREIGININYNAKKFFPTGSKLLDEKLKEHFFTDKLQHANLVQDPGNYSGKQLILELNRGVLLNLALIYWHWRTDKNLNEFNKLVDKWDRSSYAPSIIITLLRKIKNLPY